MHEGHSIPECILVNGVFYCSMANKVINSMPHFKDSGCIENSDECILPNPNLSLATPSSKYRHGIFVV